MSITAEQVKNLARECGFELAGIAAARPHLDFARFDKWRQHCMAGEMEYLSDHRGDKRADPRTLLPSVQSIVCVGKLYNTDQPYSTEYEESGHGWISRYAWGADYHDVLRDDLNRLVNEIARVHEQPLEWKVCVDTAPLLERSYARSAGLGWIGKNTCLINQAQGSWFFLGEILLSIPLAVDAPVDDRCGTCTRCIDACPTNAIVPSPDGGWRLDARACISYLTIEKRGDIPEAMREALGSHLFGCDICQDVCPWNRRAAVTGDPAFQPRHFAPPLSEAAQITEEAFRADFRDSPIRRAKHQGFTRNAANALANFRR